MRPVSSPIGSQVLSGQSDAQTWVHEVTARDELQNLVQDWQDLADTAIEPNFFFEPWNLLPALDAFAGDGEQIFAFVFHRDTARRHKLIGFVPFETKASIRGLPARTLSAWTHPHCLLSTPLLHKDHAHSAWRALMTWAQRRRSRPSLLEFPLLLAQGRSYQVLVDVAHSDNILTYALEEYTRACLEPAPGGGQTYIRSALSSGRLKELKRQRRRLHEIGGFNVRRLDRDDGVSSWIDHFLTLEGTGWKTGTKTALLCNRQDSAYFRRLCEAAFVNNRLHMIGFFQYDKPIALKCSFLTADGGFALKIAYDESFEIGRAHV
jgi:CelD/BcsL family acetyltransferase involved in cellulose biosynthesis